MCSVEVRNCRAVGNGAHIAHVFYSPLLTGGFQHESRARICDEKAAPVGFRPKSPARIVAGAALAVAFQQFNEHLHGAACRARAFEAESDEIHADQRRRCAARIEGGVNRFVANCDARFVHAVLGAPTPGWNG